MPCLTPCARVLRQLTWPCCCCCRRCFGWSGRAVRGAWLSAGRLLRQRPRPRHRDARARGCAGGGAGGARHALCADGGAAPDLLPHMVLLLLLRRLLRSGVCEGGPPSGTDEGRCRLAAARYLPSGSSHRLINHILCFRARHQCLVGDGNGCQVGPEVQPVCDIKFFPASTPFAAGCAQPQTPPCF
jgi:hypothetical protein